MGKEHVQAQLTCLTQPLSIKVFIISIKPGHEKDQDGNDS